MKLITAIIREDKLDIVRQSLIDIDVTRITVTHVSGRGKQEKKQIYRGQQYIPNLTPKIKLEIAVNDSFVDPTVETILNTARSDDNGQVGDGKIFISPLEECIRIRTGEKGSQAI